MKKQITYLLLIFFLAACGSNNAGKQGTSEKEQSDDPESFELKTDEGKIKVDKDNAKLVIEGNDNSKMEMSFGEGQSLPEDFPLDLVPIYKGSKLMATSKNMVGDQGSYVISYGSEEGGKAIKDFYKNFYSKSEIKSDMSMNGINILAVQKGDYAISIQIFAAEDDDYGKTAVNLAVVPK
jgi:hypothetical protein